jgi:hypothetical protein
MPQQYEVSLPSLLPRLQLQLSWEICKKIAHRDHHNLEHLTHQALAVVDGRRRG